jgi:hypothetical protein
MNNFSYEQLVADAATQVPQLLHAVGLSWQAACLESHSNPAPVATASAAQVRRPIYSSAVALSTTDATETRASRSAR